MTTDIQSDIAYLKDVAESGREAPSLSGRFALLWFGLLAVALLLHWAFAREIIPGVDMRYVGIVWVGMVVIGNATSYIIGRGMQDLPGQSAPHNKVDSVTWTVSGIGLALFALTIVGTVILRPEISIIFFDIIIPTAFLLYAVNYAATAAFTKTRGKWVPVFISVATAMATIALVGIPELYLVATVGVTALWLTSGLRQLREEPKTTV